MIKLNLATIALNVSVDRETNSLSIFNVLEQVNTAKLPGAMHEIVLVAVFEKGPSDPEESTVSVKVVSPSKKTNEITNNLKMNFQGNERNRLLIRINNFQFIEYGKHFFELKWEGGKYDIPLDVKQPSARAIPS